MRRMIHRNRTMPKAARMKRGESSSWRQYGFPIV